MSSFLISSFPIPAFRPIQKCKGPASTQRTATFDYLISHCTLVNFRLLEDVGMFSIFFCLGTGVPRHSAGGVGTFVRTYVVRNQYDYFYTP